MKPKGIFSIAPDVFNTEVHVNRFYMEYYDSGEVTTLPRNFTHLCCVLTLHHIDPVSLCFE